MTIQNFASFEADTAQTSATSKLVKAWEAKNAKRAVKASGVSLMAITLSACNGSGTVNTDTQNDGETQLNEDAGGPQVIDGVGTDTTPIRLTSNPDTVTFEGIAYAGRVWSPGGNVQTNSLNDDDVINGTATGSETLIVNLVHDTSSGETIIAPEMNNVETMNVSHTDTQAPNLDLEDVTGLTTVNVDRIEDTAAFIIDNLPGTAVNLAVDGSGNEIASMTFGYDRDANASTDDNFPAIVNVSLTDLQTTDAVGVTVDAGTTINLSVEDDVTLSALVIDDAATLNISGTDDLTISALSSSEGVLSTIDASSATGTLDIQLGANDLVEARVSGSSGTDIDFSYVGSTGNDTIRVDEDSLSAAPTGGDDDNGHDTIDGNTGVNTLDFTVDANGGVDLVQEDTSVANIQTVRIDATDAANGAAIDLDASLIGGLETVILRNNDDTNSEVANFDINEMAAGVLVQVQHASNTDNDDVADTNVYLHQADGTGTSDSQTVEIISGANTSETFDFTLDVQANDADAADVNDAEVENLTIIDSDTENNIVDIDSADEHTGTLTLTGGRADDTFTVTTPAGAIIAETVDASAQLSDVTITVGTADQDITMGSGDDTIIFEAVDDLDEDDVDVDGGEGADTILAVFNADPADDLEITNVETLQAAFVTDTAADDSVTIDITNSDDVVSLALMGDGGTYDGLGALTVVAADVITLEADSISSITLLAEDDTDAIFNGLTISSAASATPATMAIAVNWQEGDGSADAAANDDATVGVITLDADVTTLNLSTNNNEDADVTTYNGILAAGLTSLVITDGYTAANSANYEQVINLDDTTGLTSVDATGALGGVDLNIEALADSATIDLRNVDDLAADADDAVTITFVGDTGADDLTIEGGAGAEAITITNGDLDDLIINGGAGNDTINVSGITGDNIELNGGAGNDTITGSLLNENEIDGGAGDDTITGGNLADQIVGGAGADRITGGTGNDVMSGGAGIDTYNFDAAFGNDTITEFDGTEDLLDFATLGVDGNDGLVAIGAAASEAQGITIVAEAATNDTIAEIDALYTSTNVGDVGNASWTNLLVTYDSADTSAGNVYQIAITVTDDGVNAGQDDMAAEVTLLGTIDLTATGWETLTNADFVAV